MTSRASTPGQGAVAPRLDDRKADEVARDHARRIGALQNLPAAGLKVITGVSLADGVETLVLHRLGVAPSAVLVSAPRGSIASTGHVEERRTSTTLDRKNYVALYATGWGATITVDLVVMP